MLNGAAGYQSDSVTGLQLLSHRYYDLSIGRFLSSDPAQAGTNWYAYCDNNPLVGCDPTGLVNKFWQSIKLFIAMITGHPNMGPNDPNNNHSNIPAPGAQQKGKGSNSSSSNSGSGNGDGDGNINPTDPPPPPEPTPDPDPTPNPVQPTNTDAGTINNLEILNRIVS